MNKHVLEARRLDAQRKLVMKLLAIETDEEMILFYQHMINHCVTMINEILRGRR